MGEPEHLCKLLSAVGLLHTGADPAPRLPRLDREKQDARPGMQNRRSPERAASPVNEAGRPGSSMTCWKYIGSWAHEAGHHRNSVVPASMRMASAAGGEPLIASPMNGADWHRHCGRPGPPGTKERKQ